MASRNSGFWTTRDPRYGLKPARLRKLRRRRGSSGPRPPSRNVRRARSAADGSGRRSTCSATEAISPSARNSLSRAVTAGSAKTNPPAPATTLRFYVAGVGRGSGRGSNVEVQGELVRVRAQTHRIDLVLPLVVDPHPDVVLCEHVPLEQEVVILLEVIERLVEGSGERGDVLQLLRPEAVDVLVQGLSGIDLVLDSIQTRHQHRG